MSRRWSLALDADVTVDDDGGLTFTAEGSLLPVKDVPPTPITPDYDHVIDVQTEPLVLVDQDGTTVIHQCEDRVSLYGICDPVTIEQVRHVGTHAEGTHQGGGGDYWLMMDAGRSGPGLPSDPAAAADGSGLFLTVAEVSDTGEDALHVRGGRVNVRCLYVHDLWAGNCGIGGSSDQPHTDAIHAEGTYTDLLVEDFTITTVPYQAVIAATSAANLGDGPLYVRLRNGIIDVVGTARFPEKWRGDQRAKAEARGMTYADVGGTAIRAYGRRGSDLRSIHLHLEDVTIGDLIGAKSLWLGPGIASWSMVRCSIPYGVWLDPDDETPPPDAWEDVTIRNPRDGYYQGPGVPYTRVLGPPEEDE